jgi:hypothetical protein
VVAIYPLKNLTVVVSSCTNRVVSGSSNLMSPTVNSFVQFLILIRVFG